MFSPCLNERISRRGTSAVHPEPVGARKQLFSSLLEKLDDAARHAALFQQVVRLIHAF